MYKKLRIGITTRVEVANDYIETRDCLSHEWTHFFSAVLPEAKWIMLPNIESEIEYYAKEWELNAFIISGGNALGDFPERDNTETSLIEYAKHHSLPLLGICRGLFVITDYFGGILEHAPSNAQPSSYHKTKYLKSPYDFTLPAPAEVNSYHNTYVKDAGALTPFITDEENNIEGVFSETCRMLGIGWHPERTSPSSNFDRALIREFFQV